MTDQKKPPKAPHRRFELRKSPYDGKWRRWEQLPWGNLVGLEPDAPGAKALTWVVTGVFESRNAAFRDARA